MLWWAKALAAGAMGSECACSSWDVLCAGSVDEFRKRLELASADEHALASVKVGKDAEVEVGSGDHAVDDGTDLVHEGLKAELGGERGFASVALGTGELEELAGGNDRRRVGGTVVLLARVRRGGALAREGLGEGDEAASRHAKADRSGDRLAAGARLGVDAA